MGEDQDPHNFAKINGWNARPPPVMGMTLPKLEDKPYWIPLTGRTNKGYMSNDPKCTPISNPEFWKISNKKIDDVYFYDVDHPENSRYLSKEEAVTMGVEHLQIDDSGRSVIPK
jgi:hypothetical protein